MALVKWFQLQIPNEESLLLITVIPKKYSFLLKREWRLEVAVLRACYPIEDVKLALIHLKMSLSDPWLNEKSFEILEPIYEFYNLKQE